MKKILIPLMLTFLAPGMFAQKMQIHTSTMGRIDIDLSKIDSITFTVSGGLQVNPDYIFVPVGGNASAIISGGTPPYVMQYGPDGSIATASIAGNVLTVNGVSPGSTDLVVRDNSVPYRTTTVFITVTTGPGGLNADPNYVSMMISEQRMSTISGGNPPYSVQTPPDPTIATASQSGSVLTVTGVGSGRTYAVVKDNSVPYKTATVDIRVRQAFTTPGSLSFASNVGNYSANGIFDNRTDSMPSNTQGVGGFYFEGFGPEYSLSVVGYFKNSATDWDIVVVSYFDSVSFAPGSYPFLATPTLKRQAEFLFIKGWNPDTSGGDPFEQGSYMLATGSALISSFTTTNAQGTFSGTGSWFVQGVPDPSKPISVSGGTFNTPVIKEQLFTAQESKSLLTLLGKLRRLQ